MKVPQLLAQVTARHLHTQLSGGVDGVDGVARFCIDVLSADHTTEVARTILADPVLSPLIELKLPARLLHDRGLPESILSSDPATYHRNASCSKAALLIANIGDDEEQSLKEFVRIGSSELLERPELWVAVAADGLPLPPDQHKWWEKAVAGLRDLRTVSLDQVAEYVLRTRAEIAQNGRAILEALGAALPAIQYPKNSACFKGIKDRSRGHASAYKAVFAAARSGANYLLKHSTTQMLLTTDDLAAAFEKVRDSIPVPHHPAVQTFIDAPSGWNQAAAGLAECEWEEVKPLFDGLKREKFNIGQKTLDFYEDREADLLTEEEREYLRLLIERRTATDGGDDDRAFYDEHYGELKDDPKLKSAWDRFVFGKPLETADFLAGCAACLESLFSQGNVGTNRRLRIRCDRATKKDLRELNVDAGLYFARRYAGVRTLLGDRVAWNVGQLFDFPALVDTWKKTGKVPLERSKAKAALQLKFVIELAVTPPTGGTQVSSTQMIWKFNPDTVASQLYDDWSRLEQHPLVRCRASRHLLSTKGRFQTVDLSNVNTFVPAYDRDKGSFVAAYKPAHNLAAAWRANLIVAETEGYVAPDVARQLSDAFAVFEAQYSAVLAGFMDGRGLSHPAIITQLERYADLLDIVLRQAKGDRNRDLLLRPLLDVGTVQVEGGPPAAIVAPWHPLRLVAMARKARIVADLIRHVLTADEVRFGDSRLYFKDLAAELSHPFYPELVLGWNQGKPELLVLTDAVLDYSLHEIPVANRDRSDDTNENPTDGSNTVLRLVESYLHLHPHEQANMSVVLYNCDSARLPQAVVDKLGQLHEDEEEIRCQVMLRHSKADRLRSLYTEIVGSAEADPDAFNASEATQDFMARLRICIIADQAPPPDQKDGRPYDIVFSQDVIARHATIEWYSESAVPMDIDRLVPARWSRRRPAAKDDMKSVVYLCCPVQAAQGWSYLSAVTSFIKSGVGEIPNQVLLPGRQLDFHDPETARIFDETHNLGNWVVNYDELLDRRQLANQRVQIIRYKQSATQGRNLIISSRGSVSLLRSMVLARIQDLNLSVSEAEARMLADRFIEEANDISGDIVLRAAKRGRNASELMGIVLSRYLIRQELGASRYYGWYFLDDYAEWLGQKEQQIADILALSPAIAPDGRFKLAIVVAEAKYVEAASLAAKRKESENQLRQTVRRINDAVFGDPQRLDRDLWLSRLSDLILDGVQFPASVNLQLSGFRRAIREGQCEIYVRGYSHVFVSGPSDAPDCASRAKIAELDGSYQEVYGRAQVRDLVTGFLKGLDPASVRDSVPGDADWKQREYKRPTQCGPLPRGKSHHGGPDEVETPPRFPTLPPVGSAPITDGGSGKGATPVNMQPTDERGGSPVTASASNNGPASARAATTTPRAATKGRFAFDGIDALLPTDSAGQDSAADTSWLRQAEGLTKTALLQFQLNAKLLSSVLTPNAALLKFAGSANLTIEQVTRRRSELLTTYGLNVIAVQPEPGAVVLALERPSRRVVRVEDVWARWQPRTVDGNQDLLIGVREADASLLFLSPGREHAPHSLIAGSTGSGKSVLMQNIILAIAATNTPAQARMILIDPKQGVDYFAFDGLPHLEGKLIDEQGTAIARLRMLVEEMDSRYAKFKANRVPNLSAFNAKVSPADRLPVIWLIHDEFAEWMLVEEYKEEVTAVVGRLGVKARAAGIYLVFAAQRPDANVMPMQLRANLGNRLILRVDSEGTSEIALGERGAERLLGKGHLLAKLEGAAGLCYAQVPFVGEDFMERLVVATRDS